MGRAGDLYPTVGPPGAFFPTHPIEIRLNREPSLPRVEHPFHPQCPTAQPWAVSVGDLQKPLLKPHAPKAQSRRKPPPTGLVVGSGPRPPEQALGELGREETGGVLPDWLKARASAMDMSTAAVSHPLCGKVQPGWIQRAPTVVDTTVGAGKR